eukprot:8500485-Ditylum_brightwellii.AAC.1
MDESKSWGDGILVWCNAARTKPSEQLGINGKYPPFIVNKKKDDFDLSIFSASQYFTAKSSTEGDMCVYAVCEVMAENATIPALDGKKS